MSNSIKLLAIDTSTEACSAAVAIDNTISEYFEIAPRAHTNLMFPFVEKLLHDVKITLKEIDVFAFGQGPGSFTGVRIAASIIKGFGFAFNKPIVPVSTLRALAQSHYRNHQTLRVLSTMDARLSEIYWGLFEVDDKGIMQPKSKESVQLPEEVSLPGPEWQKAEGYPHAYDIAQIALSDYKSGKFVFARDANPVYVRDKVTSTK